MSTASLGFPPNTKTKAKLLDDLWNLLQTAFGMSPSSCLFRRMINLLQAQKNEIHEMKPYIETKSFPSLHMTFSVPVQVTVIDSRTVSLQQIYAKIDGNIKNLVDLSDTVVWDTLVTLVQALQEGERLTLPVLNYH